MNPGQSVKDRAGLFIIRDAEAAADCLRPGGVIVEGTAGNTGIGLTLVAKALGYRTVIVIPDTQSQEKKDALQVARRRADRGAGGALQEPQQLRETVRPAGRAAGEDRAERRDLGQPVRQCRQPRRPYPHHGAKKSGRRPAARSTASSRRSAPAARWPASPSGSRPGSTDVKIALADPLGAALYSFYTEGVLKAEGSSITEGIGQGRITANLEGFTPDFSFQVPDEEALPIVFDLVAGGGPVPRRLDRHQHCRRDPAGAGARAGPHHRDHPCRLRHALPVEAVQPGIPALEEPAGAGLDGARRRRSRCRSRRWRDGRHDGCPVPRRRLSRATAEAKVVARQRSRRHHSRPDDLLCHVGRAAGRYRLPRTRRRQPDRDRRHHHRRDQGRDHPCAGRLGRRCPRPARRSGLPSTGSGGIG